MLKTKNNAPKNGLNDHPRNKVINNKINNVPILFKINLLMLFFI